MDERIELVVEEKQQATGFSIPVVVSMVVHTLLIAWFVHISRQAAPVRNDAPIPRYIELMKQNREHTEAPGPRTDTAPLNAPLSDANRKASMPEPTGDLPTTQPGDGGQRYQALPNPAPRGPQAAAAAPPVNIPAQQPGQQQQQGQQQATRPNPEQVDENGRLVYREQTAQANAAALGNSVDWRNAIKEVGKVASLGGGDGIDLGRIASGEKGFAEAGPLSFESQWYDWGEYASSMVSKIRVHWYTNMPQLIRSGMKGVVTIRFTIQRDGRITDITLLEGSGIPPYDFAARKALELASPLAALPKDFPNPSERVTARFFYNMEVPAAER